MSTVNLATIQSNTALPPTIENSSGVQIGTFCRAWVNFNGTGTVAIRASFNVSSITDGGTGQYTVNLITAISDANYSVTYGVIPDAGFSSGSSAARMTFLISQATSSFVMNTGYQANGSTAGVGFLDYPTICASVFS